MSYVRDLLAASLDGAGRIAVAVGIGPGVLAVLSLLGIVRVSDASWQQWALWILASAVVGFIAYILVFGPYRLVMLERQARKRAEEQSGPYVVTNIGQYINVNLDLPDHRQVMSGSNTLFRSPLGEGLVLPPGTITNEIGAEVTFIGPGEDAKGED